MLTCTWAGCRVDKFLMIFFCFFHFLLPLNHPFIHPSVRRLPPLWFDSLTSHHKLRLLHIHVNLVSIGLDLRLDILDTGGSYVFPAMRTLAIKSADGFLLVCAADDPASLEVCSSIDWPSPWVGLISLFLHSFSSSSQKVRRNKKKNTKQKNKLCLHVYGFISWRLTTSGMLNATTRISIFFFILPSWR